MGSAVAADPGRKRLAALRHVLGAQIACESDDDPEPAGALRNLQQAVCSRPECQRRRRADYHRRKLEADPEYRQIAHATARRSGAKLIPTIFPITARNIRKRSNGIANASNGGTKSAASGGLKKNNSASMQVFIFE
jgi:hypothetical protein